VLTCKSPQDLCRHRRITVAPKFTGQMGFYRFCGFFSARLCLENRHRDINRRNFCLNRFFSLSTCTFQSSSVPGEYLVLVQKMCYFPYLSAIPSPCHPSTETIPKHWHHIHLYPAPLRTNATQQPIVRTPHSSRPRPSIPSTDKVLPRSGCKWEGNMEGILDISLRVTWTEKVTHLDKCDAAEQD
jgi:hypothetical protein